MHFSLFDAFLASLSGMDLSEMNLYTNSAFPSVLNWFRGPISSMIDDDYNALNIDSRFKQEYFSNRVLKLNLNWIYR